MSDHRSRPRRHRGEGTIWTRPNGTVVFTAKLEGGGTRSVSARTRTELKPKMDKLKREIAQGAGKGGATPLRVWARYWLDEVCPDRVKPTTLTSHSSKMEQYVIPTLGRFRLRDLTAEHVRALYRQMADDGLSTATIRQTHAVLSRCLRVAMMDGKIERNPCESVEPPKPTKPPELAGLSIADCARVLAWLRREREPREVARWSVALLGGLRQGEALGLDWRHVNLEDGVIHVRQAQAFVGGEYVLQTPKTVRSVRSVPMMGALRDDLRAMWEVEGRPAEGLIFGPANASAEARKWKRHQESAKIAAPVSIHGCRRTTASILSAAGVPSRIVADILGHANAAVTDEHYVRTEIETRRAGVDKAALLLEAQRA